MAKQSKLTVKTLHGDTTYSKAFDKLVLDDYEDSDILEFARDKYLPVLNSGTTLAKITVLDYESREVAVE